MHLTIAFCFFISRLYVNLLTWLWPCIWLFHFAFSFPASMWTCWFHSHHAPDHSVLISHFQMLYELVCIWIFAVLTCFSLISVGMHLNFSFSDTVVLTCYFILNLSMLLTSILFPFTLFSTSSRLNSFSKLQNVRKLAAVCPLNIHFRCFLTPLCSWWDPSLRWELLHYLFKICSSPTPCTT